MAAVLVFLLLPNKKSEVFSKGKEEISLGELYSCLLYTSYYWRLRKVREAYLKTADHTQTFVEVPSSAIQPVNMAAKYKIIALIRGRNNLTLEITEQASDSFLKTLLGVLGNAQ